jgi:hypothetical protein
MNSWSENKHWSTTVGWGHYYTNEFMWIRTEVANIIRAFRTLQDHAERSFDQVGANLRNLDLHYLGNNEAQAGSRWKSCLRHFWLDSG